MSIAARSIDPIAKRSADEEKRLAFRRQQPSRYRDPHPGTSELLLGYLGQIPSNFRRTPERSMWLCLAGFWSGALGGIRTPDPQIRSYVLRVYPSS